MKQLIKNGYIIDPATKKEGMYDLLIVDGYISKVEKEIKVEQDMTVVDATNICVMPGFIDLHVHLREPGYEYKETIQSGAAAAARGGFTSICPMPNTKPAIDSVEMVEFICEKAKKDAIVNVFPIGAVTKAQNGDELCDIVGMAQKGAVAISEDGKSVMDTAVYLEGMKLAKEANIPVFAHCEDKNLVGKGVLNAGKKAKELGMPEISNAVEDVIVARDIIMAKEIGTRLHLCHCSTKDSVAFVKLAKEWGQPVTAEVCPHHFSITEEDILEDDANFKMNPPLRKKEDVKALKEGLRDNIMDIIATDHAPHGAEEKKKSIKDAPFGIVGLETAFALTVTELVEQGYLTKMQLAEKMSYNPAKVIGIERGSLEVGKIADIVLVDFEKEYKIDANKFVSKGKNTPFHGKSVKGMVLKTFVSGHLVYDYEKER